MDISLQEAQANNYELTVEYVDGSTPPQPVAIDGTPVANSSNEAMARLMDTQNPSAGMYVYTYELFPVAGSFTLSGFGDADVDPGEERRLEWSEEHRILAGEAQTVRLSTGRLVPKVAPTPPTA